MPTTEWGPSDGDYLLKARDELTPTKIRDSMDAEKAQAMASIAIGYELRLLNEYIGTLVKTVQKMFGG